MKKFNVKALSLAVAAAVVSSAAGAVERDLGSIPEKAQNAMAFQTVFGENTKFDEDTGKFTFDKDSSALLLKTMELEQAVNGFAAGSNFVATNEDGKKIVREATNADIEADSMKGVGLAGGITAVNTRVDNLAKDIDEALDEQDKAVDQLVDELKNTIASNNKKIAEDMTAMGEEISGKFNDVDNEISKASSELSESIEKVSADVNKRVDSLEQETAAAKASAKAAEEKVTELSANVDSKVKEAKDAADKAVDAASKIDAVADKADKASKGVAGLTVALEKVSEQSLLASAENAQALNGFEEGDEIVVTDKDGIKSIKTATKEDVENADFEGMGLKGVIAAHDETLDDLTKAVTENNEALVKTAEVVNDISKDVNANKAALEEQKEANEGFNNAIASLDKDIGDLALAGQAAMEALEVNRKDIDANKQGIVDLTKGLGLAAEAVEDNRKEIDANKAAIATKADKADVDELVKYTADMGKKVNDIGDVVTELGDSTKEAIAAVEKDIDANKQGIVDLTKGLGLAAEAVEDNRKEIDANKAAIATKADKADVDELVKYTADMGKKVNDIGDVVTELGDSTKEAIAALEEDIDGNKTAIENKADKKYVEEVRSKAIEAKELAQSVQGSVEVAEKSAKAAAGSAQAAQKAADANAAQVETNKADIVTLKTASSQHAAGIAKNSARIDSLDKNVANLRKETRQGLAAQAALSGLFQPYSVGKFNVTAALGGFKSDTAVAVGAGYRFNENFAAKAGLAVGTSSGGSASYNVGVNYEW